MRWGGTPPPPWWPPPPCRPCAVAALEPAGLRAAAPAAPAAAPMKLRRSILRMSTPPARGSAGSRPSAAPQRVFHSCSRAAPRVASYCRQGRVAVSPSRWARIKGAMTAQEWRRAGALAAVGAALHVIGVFVLLGLAVPQDLRLGGGAVFGLGLGVTAYTLGMRHAFDADHIGAIDNVTRKLMSEGQRPLSAGFFFSLGHSTVVIALATLLAFGIRGLSGAVESDSSGLHQVTGLIGPSVSGFFLLLIGILNLIILVGIVRVFRRMRHGHYDEQQLEAQLNARALMNRLYGRATRAIRKPWQMYPLGLLFGLGF